MQALVPPCTVARRAYLAHPAGPSMPQSAYNNLRLARLCYEILTLQQAVSAWIYTHCSIRCIFNFLQSGDKLKTDDKVFLFNDIRLSSRHATDTAMHLTVFHICAIRASMHTLIHSS